MADGVPYLLTIRASRTGLIAHVSGEIDLSSAGALGAELLGAADGLAPPGLVVLDFSALTFFGAAAMHALRDFAAAATDRGVRTHLVAAPDGIVHRVATLTGFDAFVPLFAALDQAL